jgi:O-antigen/teichoic acid export membrane protein
LGLLAVMARRLTARDLGQIVFALAVMQLLSWTADGVNDVVARTVAHDAEAIGPSYWAALCLKAVICVVVLGATVVFAFAGHADSARREALVLIGLSTCLDVLASTGYALFQGQADLLPETIGRAIERLMRSVGGVGVLLAGGGVAAVCSAYVAGSAIAFAYITTRVRRDFHPAVTLSVTAVKRLARGSSPIALGGAFDAVAPSITTLLLASISGAAAVAYFGAASRVVDSTLFIGSAFAAAALPVLARAHATSSRAFLEALLPAIKAVLALLLPIAAAFVFFGPAITHVVLGHRLDRAIGIVELLGPTVVLAGLAFLAVAGLVAQNRQRALPWLSGAILVETLILVPVLIPRYSFHGAAIVTLATELTYTVVLLVLVIGVEGLRMLSARQVAGPGIAVAGMAVAALIGDRTLVFLVVGLVIYFLTLLLIERLLFPADVEALRAVTFGPRDR